MAVGATLTPHFREFLPPWLARQPWCRAGPDAALRPVGYFRFEDPAGRVGIETHLLTDGSEVYHVPMTFRGEPGPGMPAAALIATADHSVLGTRWIYDGEADPLWRERLLDLVWTNGVTDPGSGALAARARGELRVPGSARTAAVRVRLVRVPVPGAPALGPDAIGVVTGTWQAGEQASVSGCLAVITAD
ncbi:maltokinase N-terminal cap-like domain-containing protein [Actinokineospora fastidiosa]|uniref:maltokinase N-terminal cap-like domain-containing protein n=1 Tax=Actinokineospora fastidiosa TaxID=1816 RepID=UPI00166F7009|nr:hypothetical protein [Actinokineospora fastidiosa]